ncbi:MAG: Hsp20/alpha crystallin family protein, partial [Phenylobacterium sp.]
YSTDAKLMGRQAVGKSLVRGVAGFTAETLQITLEDRQLTIAGRREDAAKGDAFLPRGIASRRVIRSFVLADGVQVDRAVLEHGLLHVDLSRPEPEREIRRIPIQSAG